MSFTSTLKNELITIEIDELTAMAELAALLGVLAKKKEEIILVTENVGVAKRIFNLVKKIYQINCQINIKQGYSFNKKHSYVLTIMDYQNKLEESLGIDLSDNQNQVKNYIIEDESSEKAYLRGIFLAAGSLSDPKKTRYHLEFSFEKLEFANFIKSLLNDYELNAKVIDREKKYMVYLKEAEKISDFLKIIGAGGGLFYFEDIRIYRDHKNMTNRLNNCEQANVDKIVMAANEQIKQIEVIMNEGLYDALNEKLKVVVDYRIKYPDVSLEELANIISIESGEEISKSGVYHRLQKIVSYADKIKKS